MKRNIKILLYVLFPYITFGQYIENPSFETDVLGEVNPKGWSSCNDETTLDSQPGEWEITTPPSDGISYLGMSARGANRHKPKNEATQVLLTSPLIAGECYDFSIDLAQGIAVDSRTTYVDALKVAFWGGKQSCDKAEKLAESPNIDHEEWRRYNFLLKPIDTYDYFILEMQVEDDQVGYILLDNIILQNHMLVNSVIKLDTIIRPDDQLFLLASEGTSYSWRPEEGLGCKDCPNPEVNIEYSRSFVCRITDSLNCPFEEAFNVFINVFIPNVFTPNNDGVNDIFRVDGLRPGSILKVFDRKGVLVYENSDYQNQWNGIDIHGELLQEDAYWYVLKISKEISEYKGYVYIKR